MFDFLPHINPIDLMKDPLHRIDDISKKITRPILNFGDIGNDITHLPGNVIDFIADGEKKLIEPITGGIQSAGYPLIFGVSVPVIMALALGGVVLLKVL